MRILIVAIASVGHSLASKLAAPHEVVGVAGSLATAMVLARQHHPAVALVGISPRHHDYPNLIRSLAALSPAPYILVTSTHDDAATHALVRRTGARGLVAKAADPTTLRAAIDAVVCGQEVFSRPGGDTVISAFNPACRITARQQTVLRLVATGLTYNEIGHHLGLSPHTVDMHLRHLRRRLGARRATDLVRLATRHGFLA